MRADTIDRTQVQQEALTRAVSGQSLSNWPAIIHGFIAKGIPEADIRPRENVFTYNAWRALGRQVRRGEHGVKVCTFRPVDDSKATDPEHENAERPASTHRASRPWFATVFHVSQTDPIRKD